MIRLGCPVWQRGCNEHGLMLHTDGADAPPVFDLLILHCVQSAAQGGESILCDAGKLYNTLKNDASLCWVAERLTTVPVNPIARWSTPPPHASSDPWPLFDLSSNQLTVAHSGYAGVVNEDPEPLATTQAIQIWDNIVGCATLDAERTLLRNGSTLFCDNRRMLHGRTAYCGERVLVGIRPHANL